MFSWTQRWGGSAVTMLILVTSASGINGNGYGALLAFKRDGTLIGYWHSVQTGLSFATQARSQD